MHIGRILAASTLVLALSTGCADSDDEDTTAPEATTDPAGAPATSGSPGDEADEPDSDRDAADAATSGGDGRLVLGDETIEFDEILCMLEPQDAAAGGGQILFVGQGMGVDAAGQDVLLDVSRYDQDSEFEGDVVSVEIGDLMAGDNVSLESRSPVGTVTVEGSTIRLDQMTLENVEDGSQQAASFELTC